MHGPLPSAALILVSFSLGYAGGRLAISPSVAPAVQHPTIAKATHAPAAAAEPEMTTTAEQRIGKVFALVEKRSSLPDSHALYAALLQMTAGDFAAAAEDVPALVKRLQKLNGRDFAEAWLDRWLQIDAAGALQFLGASDFLEKITSRPSERFPRHFVNEAASGLWSALARRETEWLERYVEERASSPTQHLAVYSLLNELALRDLPRAKQFAARFENGPNRAAALCGLITGIAASDARAALPLALAEEAPPLRQELLSTAFAAAAEHGLPLVQELLDLVTDPILRQRMAVESLSAIVKNSPVSQPSPGLLDCMKQEVERVRSASAAIGGAHVWSELVRTVALRGEAELAADWAATLEADPERRLFASVAWSWAQTQPERLQQWLTAREADLDLAAVQQLSPSFSEMARRDPGAAERWADSLPPGNLRNQVRFSQAITAAGRGYIARVDAAYDAVAATDAGGTLAVQLAKALAERDGAAAAAWAMRLPAGAIQDEAFGAIANEWGTRRPAAAAEWLQNLPPGKARDEALVRYVLAAAFADPRAAADWVDEPSTALARKNAASFIYSVWQREDPAAARSWLRALPGVDENWRQQTLGELRW